MTDQPIAVDKGTILQRLSEVPDPEIPNISVVELGMIKSVEILPDEYVVVVTPTFTGCPAKESIINHIKSHLESQGITPVNVKLQLSPAWTVNDIDKNCFNKLKQVGIAPPVAVGENITCPKCGSDDTKKISFFGSTSCKSQFSCNACLEPFEYFKGIGQLDCKINSTSTSSHISTIKITKRKIREKHDEYI